MEPYQFSSTLNLNKICRICLLECGNMFSVYSTFFEENGSDNIPRIHEILNQISSIKIESDDKLPKLICSKCIDKAHSSYHFQLQCNRSQSFLNTYIAQLSKSVSNKNTENSVQSSKHQRDSEVKIKNEEKKINKKMFKETCSTTANKYESSNKQISRSIDTIKCSECGNMENCCYGKEDIDFEEFVMNNSHFEDNYNDDFNSESDMSLSGEDMLNTEDILKSLDIISNVGNQEDLDLSEDEDCDDLKSCILLGDETVDQLIKDNLQIDNLESLPLKMELFNFNSLGNDTNDSNDKLTLIDSVDKSPCQNAKILLQDSIYKLGTSNDSSNKFIKNDKGYCEDYFTQLDKEQAIFQCTNQKQIPTNSLTDDKILLNQFDYPTCTNTDQLNTFQHDTYMSEFECNPLKMLPKATQLTTSKTPTNVKLETVMLKEEVKKHNIESIPLNSGTFESIVSKTSLGKLIEASELQILTSKLTSNDNLLSESADAVQSENFPKSEAISNENLAVDSKLNTVLLQNPIHKIDTCSIKSSIKEDKLTSNLSISNSTILNKTNQQEGESTVDSQELSIKNQDELNAESISMLNAKPNANFLESLNKTFIPNPKLLTISNSQSTKKLEISTHKAIKLSKTNQQNRVLTGEIVGESLDDTLKSSLNLESSLMSSVNNPNANFLEDLAKKFKSDPNLLPISNQSNKSVTLNNSETKTLNLKHSMDFKTESNSLEVLSHKFNILNKRKQQNREHLPASQEPVESIVEQSTDDTFKPEPKTEKLPMMNLCKVNPNMLENCSEKFKEESGLLSISKNNLAVKTTSLNKKSIVLKKSDFKLEFNSTDISPKKLKNEQASYSNVVQNKNFQEISKNSSYKLKVDTLPFKNSVKNIHHGVTNSRLVDSIQVQCIPFNELNGESTLFKHPSITNLKSKNYLIRKPDQLVLPMQINKKPIPLLQTLPKMTFSIKPREPPNMDYYKKEGANNIVEYECNICPKKFRFAHNLRFHIKNHGLEKPFICTECKKDFKVYGSLVHHSRSHSGEQPYECQVCGKRYKQSGTLTAHMRVHTGQKPFECKVCGKGFRQAPDLTYHMRTHTNEKPYMCTICGKTMSMQCHLVQHMRSHTGEKPYKCLDCGKAFPSSTRLKRHSIIHTNLKPFKCKVCNKAFNRNSSLQVHTKVHIGLKSHICPHCNRGFYWAHSLRTHMTSHFKENEKDKKDAQSCDITPEESDKIAATIKNEPLLDKTVAEDSFTIITSEDINKLGLGTYQIFTIGCSNDDIETIAVYQSECNNDQLTLLDNSSIPLSAISL